MTARLIHWLSRWRLEAGTALAVTIARYVLARHVGVGLADLAMLAACTALVWPSPFKDRAAGVVTRFRLHRRWRDALTCVLPDPATPRLMEAGWDRFGEWATVRVAGGTTVTELAGKAEHLAAWLYVDSVTVTRDPTTVAVARIRALHVDPLAGPPTIWPWIMAGSTSLWRPVPVGISDTGTPVTVTLVEHNLLVGGEPGSGKSVAVSQLVAAAALDPTCTLYLLDGKLVELAAWRPAADGFAGTDILKAADLLRTVQAAMDHRYSQLLDRGLRKVPAGTGLIVVVVDELAHYLTWPEKKARDAFGDLLRDLVSRGRAAGVVVIAATQKPSSDVIPTSLRDLFGYRWALRATTPAASDTILGTGWATQGYTSSTISPNLRGGGYLLHEAGLPVRLRAHHLTDDTITALAARATRIRADHHRTQHNQEGS
jgi:hypothetical protein